MQYKVIAYNPTLERLVIPGPTDSYLFGVDAHFNGNISIDGTVDGRKVGLDGAKLDFLTLTAPVDLDTISAKVTQITVTQPVDLDVMEARLNELDASVVLKGEHDFSTTLFPASTKSGESWICSVAGTADGIEFNVGDRVVALVDGAPNNAYAGNWLKLDYTDKVTAVAGRTGNIVLTESDITDLQDYLLATDIDSIAKLNLLTGETILTPDLIDTFAELQTIVADEVLLAETSIDSLSKLNTIVGVTLVDEVALTAALNAQYGWKVLGSGLVAEATGSGTPSIQSFGSSGGTKRRRFGVGDSVYASTFIPHDLKQASLVIPTIHWATDGVGTETVKWQVTYCVTSPGGVTSSDVVFTVEVAAAGVAWQSVIANHLTGISGLEPGCSISIEYLRVTNGATENTDDVFGLFGGFYYEADRIGTPNMSKPYYT